MQDRYAYYPGCLASLSQKELDTSTRAVCTKLGVELVELESMTCCGAGDIHEAKPDYYLHLNARILGQAEALGIPTILTICNVCTLNLRQANKKLQQDSDELERVNRNLAEVGAATYSGGVDVRHLLWEVSEGDGYERFKEIAVRSLEGLKVAPFYGCQILRPSQAARLRGRSRPPAVARAPDRGLRRRGDRLRGEDQVLRLPDRARARGRRAGRWPCSRWRRPGTPAPT